MLPQTTCVAVISEISCLNSLGKVYSVLFIQKPCNMQGDLQMHRPHWAARLKRNLKQNSVQCVLFWSFFCSEVSSVVSQRIEFLPSPLHIKSLLQILSFLFAFSTWHAFSLQRLYSSNLSMPLLESTLGNSLEPNSFLRCWHVISEGSPVSLVRFSLWLRGGCLCDCEQSPVTLLCAESQLYKWHYQPLLFYLKRFFSC